MNKELRALKDFELENVCGGRKTKIVIKEKHYHNYDWDWDLPSTPVGGMILGAIMAVVGTAAFTISAIAYAVDKKTENNN